MTVPWQARIWHFLIGEPWIWFSHSFFQPANFSRITASMALRQRFEVILRMSLIILLFSYPLVICFRTVLGFLDVSDFSGYFTKSFSFSDPGILPFYFDAIWPPILGCLLAGLFGAFFSVRLGIAAAFAVSIATGISNGNDNYTVVSMTFGLALGFIVGPLFNNIRVIIKDSLANVTVGSLTGVLAGLITGTAVGTIGGFWSGVTVVLIGGRVLQTTDNVIGSAIGLTVGGIGSCLLFSLFGWCARLFREKKDTIDLSIAIGVAVAGSVGVTVGAACGDTGLQIGGMGFPFGISVGITQGILFGGAFLPLYLLSYYRLPLYPVDAFSMVRAYQNARRNPPQALEYLQHSSLHFDECVFVPLPFITNILRTVAKQSQVVVLQEIEFIAAERPQQAHAAQTVAYEIALEDLSRRQLLEDLSEVYLALPQMLSSRIRRLNPSLAKLFSRLEEISRDAASYSQHNSINRNKRESYDALQRMLVGLHTLNPHAFSQVRLNHKLQAVLECWQLLARQAQKTLNINVNDSRLITNPYTVGPTLLPVDGMPNPIFVGRNEIVIRLHGALQKTPHPPFCLTGERRMGKSSILRQLPVLMGSSFLPVFCDLHNPAAHASIAVFCASIAETIEEHLAAKHISAEKLTRSRLEEAQAKNEVAVYTEFDSWLKNIERVLEAHNLTLLLTFDEYENLEAFRQRGLLDLDLLLSWFRSISQNSRRIALLFCGVKLVDEMGPHWTKHFVNVARIKVSFLRPTDTLDLINRPVSAHSTHSIFDEEVAEEIIRVTRCHPFLLQALCSKIVDNLNDTSEEQAKYNDIAIAITEIFENWSSYFQDQWRRSSEEQKRCLIALHVIGNAQGTQIIQQSQLNSSAVYQALDQLQERDIVIKEQQIYQFAVPIFAEWIKENYNLLESMP